MLEQRLKGIHSFKLILQIAVVGVQYWVLLLGFVEFYFKFHFTFWLDYSLYAVLLGFSLVLHAGFSKLELITPYVTDWRSLFRLSMEQLFYFVVVLSITLMFTRTAPPSRAFLLVLIATLGPTLLMTNRIIPELLCSSMFRGKRRLPVLLVGPTRKLQSMNRWIERHRKLGIEVAETVEFNPLDGQTDKEVVLDLIGCLRARRIKKVLMAGLPDSVHLIREFSSVCSFFGSRLVVLNDLEEEVGCPISVQRIDGAQFISFWSQPLENPMHRFVKRTVDIVASGIGIALMAPVICPMVWIMQRLQSPGPLFYRQKRSGLENEEFDILKFRSMHLNDEAAKQSSKGDPRIYPFGALMRKFSIDELPQLWNVFVGDMSLVGPRPHLVDHNDMFATVLKHYNVRSHVKPGITGWAQVNGFRGETPDESSIRNRLEADLYYIQNWSIFMDMLILFRTCFHVIFPPRNAV